MTAEAIWITGTGAVTALGIGVPETWRRVLAGESGLRPITLFDVSRTRASRGGQVEGIDALVRPGESRADAMALAAAREALGEAHLDPRAAVTALAIGASTGGMWECEEAMAAAFVDPSLRVADPGFGRQAVSAPAEALVHGLGLDAHRVVCSACSAGSNAVVTAIAWLRSGRYDRVLAGGVDALCRLTWSGFDGLQVMSPVPCRPFDRARQGMSLGEGAAFVVLETASSARARGAVPLAEIVGYAAGSEAHHITQPDPAGTRVKGLLELAMQRGNVDPSEVDYVHAHGTGTLQSDRAEAAAILGVLGDRPYVSSHKGQLGHTLAAAGAVGLVLTVRALVEGRVPPTGGLVEADPACPVRHVIGGPVDGPVRVALVNAFGFGGLDTVLALRHPGAPVPARPPVPAIVVTRAVAVGAQGLRQDASCLDFAAAATAFEPESLLDRDKVRRLDRTTRMLTLAVHTLYAGLAVADAGVVAGNTWGAVEDTARYLRRMLDHGGKTPDPFLFPNLVPSSPVAHAALYVGARGPVASTPDGSLPSESAFHHAAELLEAGDAGAIAVCGHADDGELLRTMYLPLLLDDAVSREGAAGLLLETAAHAEARGMEPFAVVAHHAFGAGDPPVPPPRTAARAIVVSATVEASARAWRGVEVRLASTLAGRNEASGAHALALAAALIAAGNVDEVLVLGCGRRLWSQIVLVAKLPRRAEHL